MADLTRVGGRRLRAGFARPTIFSSATIPAPPTASPSPPVALGVLCARAMLLPIGGARAEASISGSSRWPMPALMPLGALGMRGGVIPGSPIGMLRFGRESFPGIGRAGEEGSDTSGASLLLPLAKTLEESLPARDGGFAPGAIIAGEKLRPAARAAMPPLLGVGRDRGGGGPPPGGGVCCSNMAAIARADDPVRRRPGLSETSGASAIFYARLCAHRTANESVKKRG